MSKTFVEIVLILLMGFFGTVILYSIIEADIVRYVMGFLYWVLIVFGVCYCIKAGNDTDKLNASIKTTLESYYSGSTDYKDQTFVYDGKKYNYDYNTETKTLTVFDGTGTIVNSIQIDGDGKDDNKNTSDSKVTSLETETESETADNLMEPSKMDSATVSDNEFALAEKIKDKITDRYPDAVITSFDTVNLVGSFAIKDTSYTFSWADNMLEVDDINDSDNIAFYKVTAN